MGLADPLEKAAIEQTVISLGSILSVYPAASFSTLGRATGASTLSSTAGVADDGSARDVAVGKRSRRNFPCRRGGCEGPAGLGRSPNEK